jgi:glycosyltransferase involved in cell wall biosynthesis
MKILYLDHATELGGAEHSLLAFLRTLDRQQFSPTLACPPGRLADRARALDVRVIDLSLERVKGRNPLRSISRLRRGRAILRGMLTSERFDVVHANTLRSALYASGVARKSGARFLWHVRDYYMAGWARSALLRRCDLAVVPSQFIASSLGRSAKVRIVPNGIDLAEVPRDEARAAFREGLGIHPGASVVGCVGRLLPWKGQRFFIDVVARLAARLPDTRFLIVGGELFPTPGRDYPAELRDHARSQGVAERILFTGHRDDPLAALGAMNVVVNCSGHEPFGRVLIEAMACRRPVVAFRSGAVPEIVEDGSTGLLVQFPDTTGMAEAVYDLVRDHTRAEAYGEAGRHRVEAHFTLSASTRGIEAAYRELGASLPTEREP